MATNTTQTAADAKPSATVLTRVFKAGPLMLPDLNPALEAQKSLRLHESAHGFLRHATLSAPYRQGDQLIYEVEKHPVQTKG